jgi:hypothetical protein
LAIPPEAAGLGWASAGLPALEWGVGPAVSAGADAGSGEEAGLGGCAGVEAEDCTGEEAGEAGAGEDPISLEASTAGFLAGSSPSGGPGAGATAVGAGRGADVACAVPAAT